jgi:fibronectin-binding autotransporter adhesin
MLRTGDALSTAALWARAAAKGLGMSKTATITSSTSLSSSLVLTNGETLSIAAGAQVSGGASDLIVAQPNASGVVIDNAGALLATNNGESAVSLGAGGVISNASGALVAGYVDGILSAAPLTLTNAGTVSVVGNGTVAVSLASGVISNDATTALISGYRAGIIASGSLALTNEGTVSVRGNGGAAVSLASGSIINAHGAVIVGYTGGVSAASSLVLNNAGTVEARGHGPGVVLGSGTVSNASGAVISGDSAAITASGSLTLTNQGSITITTSAHGVGVILAGGVVSNAAGAVISSYSAGVSSSGSLTLTNQGSITASGHGVGVELAGGVISNAAGAVISSYSTGISSSGSLTLTNQGSITASGHGVGVELAGGMVSNAAGAVISSYSAGVSSSGPLTLTNAGTVVGTHGTAVSDLASVLDVTLVPGGTFVGEVTAGAGGTLALASVGQAGTITNPGNYLGFTSVYEQRGANWTVSSALGTNLANVTVGSSADLTLGGPVSSGVTVNLAPSATLTLENPTQFAGEIGTVGWDSEIDFANLTYSSGDTLSVHLSGNNPELVLTATGKITLALDPSVSYTGDTFQLVQGANHTEAIEVICFATGTRIATPSGEVPVERIGAGDEVLTASGAVRRVKWVGKRSLYLAAHPHPEKLRPVCIRAHAFGENLPKRDLWVSPGHAIHWQDALIPAERLVNGASIYQADVGFVTYHHVELESHDLLISEGLVSESYLDAGNRGVFEGEEGLILHPDLSARAEGAAEGCLPRLFEGPVVAAARAHLLSRLALLGFERGAEPETVLGEVWAAGRRLGELTLGENEVVIPAGVERVELRSSTFVPAGFDPSCEDCRVLGVRILSLALDGEAVSLDAPVLARGFHGVEPDGRWTDGAGLLALPPSSRPRTLSLTLAPRPAGWHAAPGPVRHAA